MSNIELLSIDKLRPRFSSTEHLIPQINDNDKEPSWDGHIRIYKDISDKTQDHKKDNLIGRIPVQVKGKEVDSSPVSKNTTKFPVEIADLRNYLNDGGAIYFVIEVFQKETEDSDDFDYQIFYNILTPNKINVILDSYGTQKTHSIDFKLFPKNKKRIETIVRNSYEVCKRQHSSMGKCISPTSINLKNDRMHIPIFEYDNSKFFLETLFENGVHAYCVKPGGIELPLFSHENLVSIEGKTTADVRFSNRHKILDLTIKITDSEYTINVGKIITMTKLKDRINVAFQISNCLEEDMFYTDMILYLQETDEKLILINDFKLDIRDELFCTMDIDQISIYNKSLHEIYRVIQPLNLNFDISLDNNKDMALAIILYECTYNNRRISEQTLKQVLETQSYTNIKKNEMLFVKQQFYDTKLEICLTKISSKRYLILNPFSNGYVYKNKKKQPISVFDMINQDDYCEAGNIKIDEIVNSYQSLPLSRKSINSATRTLLNLLGAYDYLNRQDFSNYKCVCYRNSLLRTAKELAGWISKNHCDKSFTLKSRINLLQTIRRERPFSEDEVEQIKDMIDNNSKSANDDKFALYLLLDDQKHAQKLFETLTVKDQDFYRTLPIFHFAHFQKSEQAE